MSRKVATLVYDRRVGSAARKAVLAYFADRADDFGCGIFASKQTIADETELGRSTVIRVVNEFVSEGVLLVVGSRPCRNGATVVYDINLAALKAFPAISDGDNQSQSGTSSDEDQSQSGTPPVPERDPMGSQSGTQTVLEPSLNQEEPPLVPPQQKPAAKARLPDDWELSDDGWAYARSQQIPDDAIRDEARGFHAYWTDRTDRDAKKSDRGWEQCWAGWCRRIAPRYRGRMARHPHPGGGGRGGSIASIAAQRALDRRH